MSRITKMKYVAAETIYDYSLPTPNQTICKIIKALGNNTHMVCTPTAEEFIVSMPRKFRRHVYVKRGSYVVTEPIIEGKKVKAEIVRVLQRQQIKHFYSEGVWPKTFDDNVYLNNNHKFFNENSDRGFVHGSKVLYISKSVSGLERICKTDSSGTAECNSRTNGADGEESDCSSDSDTDDESDLVPNYNKKAISKMVFSDDSDDSDDDDDDDDDDSEEEQTNEDSSEEDVNEDNSEDTEMKTKQKSATITRS